MVKMDAFRFWLVTGIIVTLLPFVALGDPIYTNAGAAAADPDFLLQGEYAADGWGVQVIARGDGAFEAFVLKGGLPGAGWDGESRQRLEGAREGDRARFSGQDIRFEIADETLTLYDRDGFMMARLPRVERVSSTLGLEPPGGAIILFSDPDDVNKWRNGRVDEHGLLQEGVTSRDRFRDHRIHLEYLVPYRPHARGQGRGNSGIYVQSRYEVQMLDSFGYEPHHSHNGGIYSVAAAEPNMSYPPLRWQTYDIHFRAARFNDEGDKVEDARMTVYHNGIRVHDDVPVPHTTTAAPIVEEADEIGPIFLQRHGDNPMRYRNIWVVELDG